MGRSSGISNLKIALLNEMKSRVSIIIQMLNLKSVKFLSFFRWMRFQGWTSALDKKKMSAYFFLCQSLLDCLAPSFDPTAPIKGSIRRQEIPGEECSLILFWSAVGPFLNLADMPHWFLSWNDSSLCFPESALSYPAKFQTPLTWYWGLQLTFLPHPTLTELRP